MIRIGFDDEEPLESQFDDDGNPKIKHGDGFSDTKERKLTVFIPERRIQQMKDEYDCVVVHDFGDEYHLSEEEREAKNKFYKAFRRFSKFKHKFRRLDEFVVAMREALKCLDFVAENNGIYDPDEFKKMFFRNKIYINGLVFPQFKGREKKQLSWDYITEFILSDADPKDILPNKKEEIYTQEDYEELEDVLFDDGELDKILAPESPESIKRKLLFFDIEEDKQTGDIAVFLDHKQSKKMIKAQPEFLYEIKEMKRSRRSIDKLSRYVYDLTADDIEAIADYDQAHNYQSSSDIPVFKGDLTKDSDYRKYLLELEEFEQTQIKDNYHGKLKTLEQIQELELKQLLENHNWNIRNLYENKEKEEKLRKIQQKEKKREKELRKKLIEVQNRRKRRMGEDVKEEPKSKGKKKKKKSQEKVKDKSVKKYKKEVSENMDEFLLGAAGRLSGDFKDYKDESLDWSWGSIMKGGN